MITLYITSLDRQQQVRSFHCRLYPLEVILETLTLIVAGGNTLLDVCIVENGQRTQLPTNAFDGQDILGPILALQAQWETLLVQPRAHTIPIRRSIHLEMVLDRVDHYETLMAEYDQSIRKIEALMLSADTCLNEGLQKERLLTHYHCIVNRHYQSLGVCQTERNKWLTKLTKLKLDHLN